MKIRFTDRPPILQHPVHNHIWPQRTPKSEMHLLFVTQGGWVICPLTRTWA